MLGDLRQYVRLTHNEIRDGPIVSSRYCVTPSYHRRRADLIDLTSLARRLLKNLEELPATKDDPDAGGRLPNASLCETIGGR